MIICRRLHSSLDVPRLPKNPYQTNTHTHTHTHTHTYIYIYIYIYIYCIYPIPPPRTECDNGPIFQHSKDFRIFHILDWLLGMATVPNLPHYIPILVYTFKSWTRKPWRESPYREVRPSIFNECPVYDTKQADGEAPVMLELWRIWSTPFIAIASRSTLAWSGSTWQSPVYWSNRTVWHLNCMQNKC